jgi:hypothetical protein
MVSTRADDDPAFATMSAITMAMWGPSRRGRIVRTGAI